MIVVEMERTESLLEMHNLRDLKRNETRRDESNCDDEFIRFQWKNYSDFLFPISSVISICWGLSMSLSCAR